MAAEPHYTRGALPLPNPEAPYAALVELADVTAHGASLHGTRSMARNRGCACLICRAWESGYKAGQRDRTAAA